MPDPTQPNSSGDPPANAPNPNPAAPPAATPPNPSSAPQRPAWASDDLWDGEKNALREDALTTRLAERDQLAAELEKFKPPEAYKPELPDDVLKALPKDREIKADDPIWQQFSEAAKAAGLTQEQFKNLAGFKVKLDLAAEQANKEAVARHQESIHKALGERGPEQVEAVKTWMKGFFGPELGEQFQHALFTADMVKGFAKIQQLLTSQGVTSFSQTGREGAPDRDKIPGYENMTFEQRMHAARQASRAANGAGHA
jgi:hypothetical protein